MKAISLASNSSRELFPGASRIGQKELMFRIRMRNIMTDGHSGLEKYHRGIYLDKFISSYPINPILLPMISFLKVGQLT